jgi:hypothetical protein
MMPNSCKISGSSDGPLGRSGRVQGGEPGTSSDVVADDIVDGMANATAGVAAAKPQIPPKAKAHQTIGVEGGAPDPGGGGSGGRAERLCKDGSPEERLLEAGLLEVVLLEVVLFEAR